MSYNNNNCEYGHIGFSPTKWPTDFSAITC